jgi:hypothetical protein
MTLIFSFYQYWLGVIPFAGAGTYHISAREGSDNLNLPNRPPYGGIVFHRRTESPVGYSIRVILTL